MLGELPAVTPCDAEALASIGQELTPACKLALARGKNATLRVGGGELWDDACPHSTRRVPGVKSSEARSTTTSLST